MCVCVCDMCGFTFSKNTVQNEASAEILFSCVLSVTIVLTNLRLVSGCFVFVHKSYVVSIATEWPVLNIYMIVLLNKMRRVCVSYIVKFIESCSWFLKQQQLFYDENNVFAHQ